jgi:hypothetical protein
LVATHAKGNFRGSWHASGPGTWQTAPGGCGGRGTDRRGRCRGGAAPVPDERQQQQYDQRRQRCGRSRRSDGKPRHHSDRWRWRPWRCWRPRRCGRECCRRQCDRRDRHHEPGRDGQSHRDGQSARHGIGHRIRRNGQRPSWAEGRYGWGTFASRSLVIAGGAWQARGHDIARAPAVGRRPDVGSGRPRLTLK